MSVRLNRRNWRAAPALIATLLALVLLPAVADAAPKSVGIDKRFGKAGWAEPYWRGKEFAEDAVCVRGTKSSTFVAVSLGRGYKSVDELILKLNSRGRRDRTFARSRIGGRTSVVQMVPLRDGSVVVVYVVWSKDFDPVRYRAIRLLRNGKRDRKFAGSGAMSSTGPVSVKRLAHDRLLVNMTIGKRLVAGVFRSNGVIEHWIVSEHSAPIITSTGEFALSSVHEGTAGRYWALGGSKGLSVLRLKQDGSIDESWNGGGAFEIPDPPESVWRTYDADPEGNQPTFATSLQSIVSTPNGGVTISLVSTMYLENLSGWHMAFDWALRLNGSAPESSWGPTGTRYLASHWASDEAGWASTSADSLALPSGRLFVGTFWQESEQDDPDDRRATFYLTGSSGVLNSTQTRKFSVKRFWLDNYSFDAASKTLTICGGRKERFVVARVKY